MDEKFKLNYNPIENEKSKEGLTVVEIPKIIRGSFSDGPGEAGYVYFTTNPNFLADKELFQQINTLNRSLESITHRSHLVGMIRSSGDKVFFGASSPRFTQFPTRKYQQAAITYLNGSNPVAGNIFANSRMFGEYTKKQLDQIQGNDRKGEKTIYEAQVESPIEIPEKLVHTVQDFLKTKTTLLIEDAGGINFEGDLLVKPKGNDMFDCIPIKTMVSLYDKLDDEAKLQYSLEFTSSMVHDSTSKVVLFLQKLDDNYRKMYEQRGETILKWSDLV